MLHGADAVYDWFCNAVNGNYGNVPSPIIWGAFAALVTAVVYPPIRKRLEAFVRRIHREEASELHAKLDHIIRNHPDIPEFDPKEKR